MSEKQLKVLYIIVNAGFAEEAVNITRQCGAGGATVINARGTGANLQGANAFHFEPEKEIIISIVDEETAINIMREIKATSGTESPANGVCYCLNADRVSFINKIDLPQNPGDLPDENPNPTDVPELSDAEKKALRKKEKALKKEQKAAQKLK